MAKQTRLQDLAKNQSLDVGSVLKSKDGRSNITVTVLKIDRGHDSTFVYVDKEGKTVCYGIEALLSLYDLIQ